MYCTTLYFPLSNHHRDLAIVGLAQAGGTVRDIANAVEASTSTVRRVLKDATVAPGWGYGTGKFLISGVEWDTDGRLLKRLGQAGDPAAAFDAKAQQFAATDLFYLRPPMAVEIDPKTGILHAYAKVIDNAWHPHSPGFLPTAVVGASPLGKGSAVVGVEHGGRYHAALRLKPEDVAELNRVGRDATGDRIFFRVLKGGLQPNGLPDLVLQIDRLEIGYKNQVIGITPSKDKDA